MKKIFISDEWVSHKLSRSTIGHEVKILMFDHTYWENVSKLMSIYEALYTFLRIIDFKVIPTMSFVYQLIQVIK